MGIPLPRGDLGLADMVFESLSLLLSQELVYILESTVLEGSECGPSVASSTGLSGLGSQFSDSSTGLGPEDSGSYTGDCGI